MNEELTQRIEKLEKMLAEHQHLGYDGTKEFDKNNKLECRELNISGSGQLVDMLDVPNFRMYDNDDLSENRTMLSLGISTSLKGKANEQDNLILRAGKGEIKTKTNREDWDKNSFVELTMSHSPKDQPWYVFGKRAGTAAYLFARRTPYVIGEGIVDGKTLTDTGANFTPGRSPLSAAERYITTSTNSMVHGVCIIKNQDFVTLEANRILEVTKTEIICENDWVNQGKFRYEVLIPVVLGTANAPFNIGYFGDGLVLGYGARTANNPITSITWGSGSPEGQILAAQGSMYLNQTGGAGTCLYIKESGGFSTTGWVAK